MEDSGAEKLMNTLISKMESMDNDVKLLKAENEALRNMVQNPNAMLRKAGFVPYSTPYSEDVEGDAFRSDMGTGIMKADNSNNENLDSFSNEQIHEMTWDEIHDMASQHREVKEMY
tara:strand:+ start:354 stop:701 length:348 start_codon:yes stop_codon:yes gene_type:complete